MIYVGLDDTDMPESPGTNKLARALAAQLADRYACRLIVRHQLLQDPRVPCTSKNSAAAILLVPQGDASSETLIDRSRALLRDRFVEGSDPGLCVATTVPQAVTDYGRKCQRELVDQGEARKLAESHGIFLQGLGGTEDGVVGALAAVGLAADGNDGRVVQIGAWPDDLAGWQEAKTLQARGVEVRSMGSGRSIQNGLVDVGKHLRPNYRENRIVLFASRVAGEGKDTDRWKAIRLL